MKTMVEILENIIYDIDTLQINEILIGFYNEENKLIKVYSKNFNSVKDIRIRNIFYKAKCSGVSKIVIYRKAETIEMITSSEELDFVIRVKLRGIKDNIQLYDYIVIGSQYHYKSLRKNNII